MWEYQQTDELYHFGVPGMHWGQRRARTLNRSQLNRQRYVQAKKANKAQYSKNFDKAWDTDNDAGLRKAGQQYRDKKNSYKTAYKNEKKAIRSDIKNTTNQLYKQAGGYQIAGYGKSVYKKAAQDMVKNKTSQQDALKKQKKKARIKAAATALASVGAAGYTIAKFK